MNQYFGYLRVSTTKQGEGVSLGEQKQAIQDYAEKNGFAISQWYEEKVTAAKKGRKIFLSMLQALQAGKAQGVVVHKIDRSARNLGDWSRFVDLIDSGIDIRIVSGDFNLNDRSSRLSADLQAVISADYVRNLKEEVRKGVYGRLKQGLYPFSAPVGYINTGKGNTKKRHPQKAPLIRAAFELYATGEYSLEGLAVEMERRGLKNHVDKRIPKNGWYKIFKNPFYMGIIKIQTTGEVFTGIHAPIVTPGLYQAVQDIKKVKSVQSLTKHRYLFRRMFTCGHCNYSLIAEKQKTMVYYRCHTKGCDTTTARQDRLDECVRTTLESLTISEQESNQVLNYISLQKKQTQQDKKINKGNLEKQLQLLKQRLDRLGDLLLDALIEKKEYVDRKAKLVTEKRDIEYQIESFKVEKGRHDKILHENLELLKSLYLSYCRASDEKKRVLLKTITSNRIVKGRNPFIELKTPFRELANLEGVSLCAPRSDTPRTKKQLQKRYQEIARILLIHSSKELESGKE